MAASDDDTQRQLGILIGQMTGVIGQLSDIKERQDRSDESRKGLHGRMDGLAVDLGELKHTVAAVNGKVDTISSNVTEMKPEIELVRGIKGKAGGAILVLGAIGGILAWLINHFWDLIRTGFTRGIH